MNNISKGIYYGLIKTALYEDYPEPVDDGLDEEEESPLGKALAVGAGTAALAEAAPVLAASPGIAQTLIQGEKGLAESKALLRRNVPFVPTSQISEFAPFLEKTVGARALIGPGGTPLQVVYNKNPYMTAHEVGHLLDKKGLRRWMRMKMSDPSFLREYLGTLALEGMANVKGFGALQRQFGTIKALRGLPTMLGNMANYLVGMPLQKVPALKVILPVGAALGTLSATTDEEEDVV